LSTGAQKLVEDLTILESMAAKMEEYLNGEELFWRKIDGDPVQPTIGGFLVRQHRLQALAPDLLDGAARLRLKAANEQFDQVRRQQSRRFEQRSERELSARLRQWAQALKDLFEDDPPSMAYYRADVEVRAIIAALIDSLQTLSTQIEPKTLEKLAELDHDLRQRWSPGSFVWPAEWEPAYPPSEYWWLYGQLD